MDNQETNFVKTAYGIDYAWHLNSSGMLNRASSLRDLEAIPLETFDGLNSFVTNKETNFQILIGQKGTGKTSALARKAANILRNQYGAVIPTRFPLIATLSIQSNSLDNEDLELIAEYQNASYWKAMWRLLFYCFACPLICATESYKLKRKNEGKDSLFSLVELLPKHVGEQSKQFALLSYLDEQLRKQLSANSQPSSDFLNAGLQKILDLKLDKKDANSWVNSVLLPALKQAIEDSDFDFKHPIYLFIDAIDENFGAIRSEFTEIAELGNHRAVTENRGFNIWIKAQIGFIQAVIATNTDTNSVYRVHGAIRTEAYKEYPKTHSQDESQIKDICLEMTYSSDVLKKIFESNIERTHARLLVPSARDKTPFEKFMPTVYFSHPYVWGEQEHIWDWILRHTLKIPRHIVWQGVNIIDRYQDALDRGVSRYQMSLLVNGTARSMLDNYLVQVDWNPRVAEALKLLKGNVITEEDILAVDTDFPDLHAIKFLYRRGLVGVPVREKSSPTGYVQNFLFGGYHGNSEMPNHKYYILHPCMNEYVQSLVQEKYRDNFICTYFIAGDGLPCPPECRPKIVIRNSLASIQPRLSYSSEGCFPWQELEKYDIPLGKNMPKHAVFFIAFLLARKNKLSPFEPIKIDDVCVQIELLIKRGVIGKTNNPETYRVQFENITTSNLPQWIKKTRKILELHMSPVELRLNDERDHITMSLDGIAPYEISASLQGRSDRSE